MNGTIVMYDFGKMLKVGGAEAYQNMNPNKNEYLAKNTAHVISVNGDDVSVRRVSNMAFPRALHNSVVLPTGEIIIVGGQTWPRLFQDTDSVYQPELWDPRTEQFRQLPPMRIARNYHSVALLMPDARVFVAGGGLGGVQGPNHNDAEILTPHYLLNRDGSPAIRPTIRAAPQRATYGDSIHVNADGNVSSFALVRLSSATHSVNNDQRRFPVTVLKVGSGGNEFDLRVPDDRGSVLPGDWMLFALDAQGTPSIAKIINIADCQEGVSTKDASCARVGEPDRYVWRFFKSDADPRSDYRYVTTDSVYPPAAPAGYLLDTTAPQHIFRAWSTFAPGRSAIRGCRNRNAGSSWLGIDCLGDEDLGTQFYAYSFPVRDSSKVLHYLSRFGGKLHLPAIPENNF